MPPASDYIDLADSDTEYEDEVPAAARRRQQAPAAASGRQRNPATPAAAAPRRQPQPQRDSGDTTVVALITGVHGVVACAVSADLALPDKPNSRQPLARTYHVEGFQIVKHQRYMGNTRLSALSGMVDKMDLLDEVYLKDPGAYVVLIRTQQVPGNTFMVANIDRKNDCMERLGATVLSKFPGWQTVSIMQSSVNTAANAVMGLKARDANGVLGAARQAVAQGDSRAAAAAASFGTNEHQRAKTKSREFLVTTASAFFESEACTSPSAAAELEGYQYVDDQRDLATAFFAAMYAFQRKPTTLIRDAEKAGRTAPGRATAGPLAGGPAHYAAAAAAAAAAADSDDDDDGGGGRSAAAAAAATNAGLDAAARLASVAGVSMSAAQLQLAAAAAAASALDVISRMDFASPALPWAHRSSSGAGGGGSTGAGAAAAAQGSGRQKQRASQKPTSAAAAAAAAAERRAAEAAAAAAAAGGAGAGGAATPRQQQQRKRRAPQQQLDDDDNDADYVAPGGRAAAAAAGGGAGGSAGGRSSAKRPRGRRLDFDDADLVGTAAAEAAGDGLAAMDESEIAAYADQIAAAMMAGADAAPAPAAPAPAPAGLGAHLGAYGAGAGAGAGPDLSALLGMSDSQMQAVLQYLARTTAAPGAPAAPATPAGAAAGAAAAAQAAAAAGGGVCVKQEKPETEYVTVDSDSD